MKTAAWIFLVSLLSLTGSGRVCAYEPPVPSGEVETVQLDWHDAKRDRDVPAKVYYPKAATGRLPVVIFSHGLGGSREGYEYLGRHWAGCGYISVHLQHLGSDDAVWKNVDPAERMTALGRATLDLRNVLDRPLDVTFAIDQLTALDAAGTAPLAGRLDLQRIAIAGHSFGGHTTMVIAGQGLGPDYTTKFADSRVKCAIQMSAPVVRPALRDRSYDTITIPMFHLTGTLDDSPIGETKAAERRIPFDLMSHDETCLAIFNGGDHFIFSGRFRDIEEHAVQDAAFQKLICAGTTAFLDAFLKSDAGAHAWLMDGGFKKLLGEAATFETKQPAK